jgi:spore germination protein KC
MTGVAMDVSDNPGQISVTAQIADIQQGESSSGETSKGSSDSVIVIKRTGDSLMTCLTEMNRDSDHKMLFQHNQIRLFGIELAEQGIAKHLDMIMRDQKSRFEVPLAIVDGRGEEALTAQLSQAPISGLFLGGMFEEQAEMSVEYRVRLIDFVQRLLDDAMAPVIPIIKVTAKDENDKQEVQLDGMAVFHDDKMIGRLTNDETKGYIWSFGNVKKCNVEVTDGPNRAVLHITKLDCKRKATLRPDGGVRVSLTIDSVVQTGEIYGFKEMKPPELLKHLEKLAEEEIKNTIIGCFETAQSLNADIFGFCTIIYKQYPKQWSEMKDQWGEVFADIDLDVQVNVRIPGTGQIVQSLEMEENME